MEVYFEKQNGETLCFYHAVEAVIEGSEKITAHVDNATTDSYDSMAGFVPICHKCFPEDEELEEEDD